MIRKETVEVAMASDAGYAVGMYVTAASIALYASEDVCLSFTFLDGGIPDVEFNSFIKNLMRCHPSVSYRRIKVDESVYDEFPSWRGNKMAYARFMLINELRDIDFVIYCDVDFLWMKDIAELWKMRDENVVLQAVRDPGVTTTKEPQWFRDHGYEFNAQTYLCSGFLFMNLKMLREENFEEKAFALIRKHPDFLFADQESFVILLGERTRFLDDSWMRFSKFLESKDFDRPLVCHFVNDIPWKQVGMSDKLRDATLAWKLVAERIGCGKIGKIEKLLYFITRTLILRQCFCIAVLCLGKGRIARHLYKKCAHRIRLPRCEFSAKTI